MAQLLTLKKLREIHLVDKGAAIGARVVFAKRKETEKPMTLKESIMALIAKNLDEVLKAEGLAGTSPEALLETALAKVPEETRAAILAAVAAMYRATPPKEGPAPEPPKVEEPAKADVPAKEEPPKKEEEPVEMKKNLDEVLKGLDADSRALLEPVLKAKADAEARLVEVEKARSEEVAKRELAEQVDVAKSFAHVPGDIGERAAALLTVKKQDEKAYASLCQSLKAAEEMISKGKAMEAAGSGRSSEGGDGEKALEKLERLAKELVEKSDKKLTREQAFTRVCKANKELYNQMERERLQ